jgi:GT2 family glycosyltransferase
MAEHDELLVVDQTAEHAPSIGTELARLHAAGSLRWIRRDEPSIPAAMNAGLLQSRGEAVLFLDDDIEPMPGLLDHHRGAHAQRQAALVAGRVIQPWNSPEPEAPAPSAPFSFNSDQPRFIEEFMAGNCSVNRDAALATGGFDENFVGAAYRFERDFADRLLAAGHRIRYVPGAAIRHLKVPSGGTRSFGHHLRTFRPHHSVGEYYYLLMSKRPGGTIRDVLQRPFRAIATRHHARKPWFIPLTLIAEISGLIWALWLAARGRRLLPRGADIHV